MLRSWAMVAGTWFGAGVVPRAGASLALVCALALGLLAHAVAPWCCAALGLVALASATAIELAGARVEAPPDGHAARGTPPTGTRSSTAGSAAGVLLVALAPARPSLVQTAVALALGLVVALGRDPATRGRGRAVRALVPWCAGLFGASVVLLVRR